MTPKVREEKWDFGLVAIVGGIGFIAIYLIGRQLRKFAAWSNRTEPPKERKIVYIPIMGLIGFLAGGLLQSLIDTW